jgi:hypothetical protein
MTLLDESLAISSELGAVQAGFFESLVNQL